MGVIYGLYDPRTSELRYVGKTTVSPETRLRRGHIKKAKSGDKRYVSCWIRGLLAEGLEPRIEVLCGGVPEDELDDAERAEIALQRSLGARLTNLTEGGDGVDSTSARARCAAMSPEERREMFSDAAREASNSPDAIAKMVAANRASGHYERHGKELCQVLHIEKLPDGRSKHAVEMGAIAHSEKDSRGKSVAAVRGGKKGGAASCAQRWECDECDVVSNPGNLAKHQVYSGHIGRTRLVF